MNEFALCPALTTTSICWAVRPFQAIQHRSAGKEICATSCHARYCSAVLTYGLLQLHCMQGDVHRQGRTPAVRLRGQEGVCYSHVYRCVDAYRNRQEHSDAARATRAYSVVDEGP